MYIGIAILLFKAYFLASTFEWLIVFTNKGLKWISELPYAGITEIWLDRWQLILLSLFITTLTIGLSHYKKKYIFTSLIALLTLLTTLSYQKITSVKQSEIVLFSLRKNYAVAFINGNESILLTDLSNDDKNFEFFVKPALDQKQIKNIHFLQWDEDLSTTHFYKQGKQLVYKGKNMLMMDETFNYKKLTQNLSFDFVWMHNNPKQKLDELKQEINFSNLIIDASNKDYVITKLKHHADSLNINAKVLKKQKAITLSLN